MTFDANQVMLLELVQRVLRSWWTAVAGISVGLAAATVMLHYTPRVYQASTVIYAAPQRIPREYINVPVPDDLDVRLGSLRESVLSGSYLDRLLSTTFSTPANEEDKARLLQSIRRRVEIRAARRDRFFEIRFLDTDPVRAAKVVNTLAEFYIEENTRVRADRADETTRTMEDLANEAQRDLEAKETEVARYKARHVNELAEQLDVNMSLLRGKRDEMESIERSLEAARNRYELLMNLRAQGITLAPSAPAPGEAQGGGGGDRGLSSRIAALKAEIETLRRRYSDDHPDVKAKLRELAELEDRARAESGQTGDEEPEFDPSKLGAPAQELEIMEAKAEVKRLEKKQAELKDQIEVYEGRIARTPQSQQELEAISKDLQPLRDRYDQLRRKLEDAKNAKIVEESQRGNVFEVIDRATPPTLPVQPNPKFMYAVGVAVGVGLFVGPMILLFILRPVIASEATVRALGEVPLLISIPSLDPAIAAARTRRRWFANVILSVVFCAAFAATWIRFHG